MDNKYVIRQIVAVSFIHICELYVYYAFIILKRNNPPYWAIMTLLHALAVQFDQSIFSEW